MVKVVDFSHGGNFGESAVRSVAEHVSEAVSRPEMANISHEVIVKESIKSIAEKVPEIAIPAPLTTSSSAAKPVAQNASPLPSYLDADTDPHDEKIKKMVASLVETVFTEGLERAIGLAKKQPPFVEDAFHDALVEKLVPELRRRGILK